MVSHYFGGSYIIDVMERLTCLPSEFAKLIRHLSGSGVLRTPILVQAFIKVDRAKFVPPEAKSQAYADTALAIGFGSTISQPSTVAFMLELLQPRPGQKILEVGTGSGYKTALLSEVVGHKGKVYSMEIKTELEGLAKRNMASYNFQNIELIIGDGSQGLKDQVPFDRIIVAAAARRFPEELREQLAVGGRMVLPIGSEDTQDIMVILRLSDNEYDEERYPGFTFVPLTQDEV